MVCKEDIVENVIGNKINLPHKEQATSLEVARCKDVCFYDLYDKYDGQDVKIYQTEDRLLWIVKEVKEYERSRRNQK